MSNPVYSNFNRIPVLTSDDGSYILTTDHAVRDFDDLRAVSGAFDSDKSILIDDVSFFNPRDIIRFI